MTSAHFLRAMNSWYKYAFHFWSNNVFYCRTMSESKQDVRSAAFESMFQQVFESPRRVALRESPQVRKTSRRTPKTAMRASHTADDSTTSIDPSTLQSPMRATDTTPNWSKYVKKSFASIDLSPNSQTPSEHTPCTLGTGWKWWTKSGKLLVYSSPTGIVFDSFSFFIPTRRRRMKNEKINNSLRFSQKPGWMMRTKTARF